MPVRMKNSINNNKKDVLLTILNNRKYNLCNNVR